VAAATPRGERRAVDRAPPQAQLTDYAAYMPEILFKKGGRTGKPPVTLRGISSLDSGTQRAYTIKNEGSRCGSSKQLRTTPSVQVLDLLPYDMERPEVCAAKGPLYGAGAYGRLDQIRSKQRAPETYDWQGSEPISGMLMDAAGRDRCARAGSNALLIPDVLGRAGSLFDSNTPGYIDMPHKGGTGY